MEENVKQLQPVTAYRSKVIYAFSICMAESDQLSLTVLNHSLTVQICYGGVNILLQTLTHML